MEKIMCCQCGVMKCINQYLGQSHACRECDGTANEASYMPTLKEIEIETAKIRAGWDETMHRRRMVGFNHEPLELQVVPTSNVIIGKAR